MPPTTELKRSFFLLRKDGARLRYCADTICDVNGYGTYFKFKRDGEVTGEAQGDFHSWWIEDGASGKTWTLEVGGQSISFVADKRELVEEPRPHQRFSRSGELVAVVYTDYHTWSVDG